MTAAAVVIVITAPHSYCPAGAATRVCDRLSLAAGADLANRIDGALFLPSPPVLRAVIDLNRPSARRTEYRRRLDRVLLSSSSSSSPLLIDVHSFPRGAFDPDSDIVVLDNEPGATYARRLVRRLDEARVARVGYALGSPLNDIVEQARNVVGARALLIEYAEDLSLAALSRINSVVRSWAIEEVGEAAF